MSKPLGHFLKAGCIWAMVSSPAMAQLSFCNDTDTNASIAIGYLAGDKWTSEGWWTAQPGQCVTAVDAPQPEAFYYWHAVNEVGEFASEAYFFCAVDDVFTIIGDADCEARGHNRISFNEVQIDAGGVAEVRLTAALAPKPQAKRKAAEPAAEAATEPATAPEPETQPEPAAITRPAPSFTLNTEIATADLLTAVPVDFPGIKAALIGDWAQEGGSLRSSISPKRFEDFDGDAATGAGSWRLAAFCPGQGGIGPAVVLSYDAAPEDKLCLILDGLDDSSFTLRDTGGDVIRRFTR